jgi:hypothetical protein
VLNRVARGRGGRLRRTYGRALGLLGVGIGVSASACTTILGVSDVHFGEAADSGDSGGLDGSTDRAASDGAAQSDVISEGIHADAGASRFAKSAGDPLGIAVGSVDAYWTYHGGSTGMGGVEAFHLDGTGKVEAVASNQSAPLDIAVTGDGNVYWSVETPLLGIPGSEGGASQPCLAMKFNNLDTTQPPTCAVNAAYLTLRMSATSGDLVFLTKDSSGATQVGFAGIAGGSAGYTNIGIDASAAIAAYNGEIAIGDGDLVDERSLPGLTSGSAVCSSMCGSGTVVDIAYSGGTAYWVTSDGQIGKSGISPGTGSPGVILSTVSGTPQRIALAADAVLVTVSNGSTPSSGAVYAVPFTGGSHHSLARLDCAPFGIAVSDGSAYWTCNDHYVYRLVLTD